jgi:hypothetical protein
LLPVVVITASLGYIDRSNVAYAAVTLKKALKMSNSQYVSQTQPKLNQRFQADLPISPVAVHTNGFCNEVCLPVLLHIFEFMDQNFGLVSAGAGIRVALRQLLRPPGEIKGNCMKLTPYFSKVQHPITPPKRALTRNTAMKADYSYS